MPDVFVCGKKKNFSIQYIGKEKICEKKEV